MNYYQVDGGDGAMNIGNLLHSRGVKLEFILDEGLIIILGAFEGVKKAVAL